MATTILTRITNRLDTGLLILRIVIGVVFIAHGSQKLFTFGLPGITAGFAGMGVPLPSVSGPLATFVELLGGVMLPIGFFTRISAILIAIEMIVAILLVHISGGFFLPTGFEFALTLAGVSIAIALMGPGAYSIDAKQGRA